MRITMAKWIGICVIFNILLVHSIRVAGECTNSVSKKMPITVRDPKDQSVKAELTNCMQLMKQFPDLCEMTAKTVVEGGAIIGGQGGLCCDACGDPKCLDKVTKNAVMTVGQALFKSCKMAIRKFPFLCKSEGVMGGQCCRYCKNVDYSCVDDLTQFKVNDGKLLNCANYVKGDKCRCDKADVKEACCASCAKVDTAKLGCKCRDFLNAKQPAHITITDLEDNILVDTKVSKCKDIVKWYAWNCDQLGGDGKACCKSCEGVDTSCQDNLLFKFTLGKCVDCDCHQLARKRMLMKKACRNDIKATNSSKTVREVCCLQCKRAGF